MVMTLEIETDAHSSIPALLTNPEDQGNDLGRSTESDSAGSSRLTPKPC